MITYDTVSEAVNSLIERGYNFDFNIDCDAIKSTSGQYRLSADDFEIDEIHRFEGESDPGDEAIVYAIHSGRYGIRGVLVNAYGIYGDSADARLVAKLNTAGKVR